MAYSQRADNFFVADPVKAAAGGAAALRTVRRAAEDAGLDASVEVGGIVDRHFGKRQSEGLVGGSTKARPMPGFIRSLGNL